MNRSSAVFTIGALLLALVPPVEAQRGASPVAVHEWIAFTVTKVETADSVESMIVMPNGRRAVLPAASGSVWFTARGTLKRVSSDSGRSPIKFDYVYLLDAQGHSYQSTVKDVSYFPALEQAPASFTFQVPKGTVAAALHFGNGRADLRAMKPTHIALSARQ
jgi:hypothetical protein